MADERLGIFDRVKAFFGTVGCIGMGVFLLIPPEKVLDEMREEISDPWRVRIGIGFVAFGALFGLTALFASSSSKGAQAVAARFKGLLLAAVCGLILTGIGFTFGKNVYHAWRLQEKGTAATAVVTKKYLSQVKGTTTYSYRIAYDGHSATMPLRGRPQEGSRLSVLYLRDEPDVVLPGEAGDSMFKMIERTHGLWAAIGFTAFAVGCVLGLFGGLIRFLAGKRGEAEASK